MKALQVKRSVGRLGLARVASALAPAAAVRVGPLEYTDDRPARAARARLAPRAHAAGRDLRRRPVDDRGPRVDVLRRLGQLPVRARPRGRRRARRRHPGRARAGARPRGPRLRPAVRRRRARRRRRLRPPRHRRPRAGHPDRVLLLDGRRLVAEFVAHDTQLHRIADDMPDERAVLVEPLAGGIHAALMAGRAPPSQAARARRRRARRRHDGPRRRSPASSATRPTPASSSAPATRTSSASPAGSAPTTSSRPPSWPGPCGASSAATSSATTCPPAPTPRSTPSAASARSREALAITRPRGRVVLMGMPAEVTLDLTGLWHRETELVGAYTYGTETLPDGRRAHVRPRHRDRRRHRGRALAVGHLPARRPRRRHRPRRRRRPPGAVKIAFDLRADDARRRLARLTQEPDATPRIRPRRRPLDATDAVLARRGLQPREAAGRPQPGDLRRPSRCRRSTTSTARSATPCSTRSTRTRCRRCCSRA